MAEENEGLLAYFQRMMTKLLEVCSSETGFSDVQDDYLATMMVDSIERVFMHGRKQESNRSNSWEVLKMGVDQSANLDLLLATHTRSLERRVGMSPLEKSTEFFQYAILHRLLSNFCQQLTQNADLIQKFYFPGYILSSSEHSSMFVLQLSTLESLNFNAVWGTQNGQGGAMDDSTRPQVTSIVQGSAVSLPSPGSGKLNPSSSHSKSIPAATRPPEAQETSKPSILFGATDAPLTFSLKPRNTHSNPFAQAFTPIQSSPSDPSLSTSASSIRSSTSSLPPSFASTSSEISEPSSLASSGSLKVSSPPSSSPATSPTFQAVRTERLPETAPKSDKVPLEARPASAPIEPVIEAVVEAPSLTADSQGSTKKRAKKRTINL